MPRNPAAAKLAVEHAPDADGEEEELWITVAEEAAPEEAGDLEWLEMALRAVVAGRVRLLDGSGRHRVEIGVSAGDVRYGTSHDLFRGMAAARQGDPVRAVPNRTRIDNFDESGAERLAAEAGASRPK